jgi:hypothetical protein
MDQRQRVTVLDSDLVQSSVVNADAILFVLIDYQYRVSG